MNDNEVIRLLITILRDGLTAREVTGVDIAQSYQPTQQGTTNTPTLYLHKVDVRRYGYPGVESLYNADNDNFDVFETIWIQPTFQISSLVSPDPSSTSDLTASDLVEIASTVLQVPASRQALLEEDIGILRITQIRVGYFVDERGRHRQEPSFDVTLSFRRSRTVNVPQVSEVEERIESV